MNAIVSCRQLSPLVAVAFLLFLLLLAIPSPPASAAATVQGLSVTTEWSTYFNVSGLNHVVATANVTFNGNGLLDDVRFDWFYPGAPLPFVTRWKTLVGSTSPTEATDEWFADREGRGFNVTAAINVSAGGGPQVAGRATFNVLGRNAIVDVTSIVVRTGSVYENRTVASARADLTWSGVQGYLGDVRFDWLSPDGSLANTTTYPNAVTGTAWSNWTIDRSGAGFRVNATYLPKPSMTNTTTFDVVPEQWNTNAPLTLPGGRFVMDKNSGPWRVCSNLSVPVGTELVIERGTSLKFCRGTGLFVNGTLTVDGVPTQRVYFVSLTSPMQAGDWVGLTFFPAASPASTLSNAVVQAATVGVAVHGTSLPVVGSSFSLIANIAIWLNGSSSVVGNNTVAGANIGVRLDASTGAVIDSNRIERVRIGVLAFDSDVRLAANAISDAAQVGLQAVRTDLRVEGGTFRDDGEYGVYLQSAPRAYLANVTIAGGNTSFRADGSPEVTIERSALLGSRYRSVYLTNSLATVVNSTLASLQWDLYLVSSPTTLINSTYAVLYQPVNSTLTVKNFLHVLVESSLPGIPRVSNAWVNVSSDGSAVLSRRTNTWGMAPWILLTDRVIDSSRTRLVSNEALVAASGLKIVSSPRAVDMSTSHLERFVAVPDDNVTPPDDSPSGIDPVFLVLIAAVLGSVLVAMPLMRRRRNGGAGAKPRTPPNEVVLESGTAYLLADEKPDRAFQVFESQLARGAKGLVITRIYPDDVRKRYRIKDVPVLWLSRGYGKGSVNPTNLGAMIGDIEKFASGKEDSIVLFDGLEYLLVQNEPQKVVKFVQTLADTASVHHMKVLLPFNLKSVDEARRALLTRDLQTL